MIEVKNLYKNFGNKCLFNNISIKINDGESLAIIGKSGIGKSVLLKHICGLIAPDSGKINIDNQEVNKLAFKDLQQLRMKIGVVFQSGALFDCNVLENIRLALIKLTNLTKSEIDERIDFVLSEVGMLDSKQLTPNELSGGMIKRVAIARAISAKPKYLLYDEPTTGLDPVMVTTINNLMKKIHEHEKITSIIVTHELKTVFDVADRVLMLDEGEIIYDGIPLGMKDSRNEIVNNFVSSVYSGERI